MITVKCIKCGDYLEEVGGLLFSPPTTIGIVTKLHLCVKCYNIVRDEIG